MTAKPQPMAGQSDAADDLIAELAKLMAQDAQTERPAQPAVPAFSVRIPGGEPQKPATPSQNFDFSRAVAQPAAPQAPARPLATTAEEAPEPFRFDFGAPAKRDQAQVTTTPVAAAPQASAPQPAVALPVARQPGPIADHDSIADLIAAELFDESPAAPVSAPTPTNDPVGSTEPRPAPVRSSGWAPTAVATNLGNNDGQPRAAIRPVNLQPISRSEQDQFKVPPVFGLGTTPAPEPTTPVFEMPADLPVEPEAALAQPEYTPPQQPIPVVPVSVAPVEPLVERQTVPPAPVVVAPPQPAKDDGLGLDPIDEIESLIGRAMRVEFDKPVVEERVAPSPALRSLATPTMPAPSSSSHALSGADEAIFAAAQATGAQVGWVEAPEVSEPEPVSRKRARPERAPRASMTRAIAGPLVAVTLLLAAGFGLYWVVGFKGESGPAPLLTADATPIKETPAVQPDAAAAQQSVVFNEMDGVVPGTEEQLVSRDQSDVNEVTQVAATPDMSEEGLANRKVRTVTVRPDGTIVSGDDSVAGSAILPVDRPNVPVVPGAETASPELLAAAAPQPVTPAAVTPEPITPEPEPAPAVAPVAAVTPVEPGATVPAVDQAGNAIAGKTTVVPLLRPSSFAQQASAAGNTLPAAPVNAFVDPAASVAPVSAELQQPAVDAPVTQPAAIPAGATEVAAVGNNAPAYVQLASQRSEEEARATAGAMVTRFGPLFGGANMEVQRVDLGAKGIYYRVRVPASSLQDANSICANVKAAGGDCFTM